MKIIYYVYDNFSNMNYLVYTKKNYLEIMINFLARDILSRGGSFPQRLKDIIFCPDILS